MKNKKWSLLALIFSVFGVVLIGSFWLTPPKVTEAACGASTSSCKTCHEVQGTDPVSKKGDWHIQHSFGDFCQACHLGVATETDKTKAHAGLVAKPLAQPDQSCASCHPADAAVRVAKYGGAAVSTPAGSTTSAAPGTAPAAGSAAVTPSAAATQVPPSANPNFDILDFNSSGKLSWVAWAIIIANILALLVLAILLWKWRKGLWPWSYVQGHQKNVPFNTLPQEVKDVFNQLLKGDLQTVLALQKILEREHGSQLLQAMTQLPEDILTQLQTQTLDENELKSLSSLGNVRKNGKGED
ncbi:MAG TPA: cytochrome c3 family protein [Desulfosporosinus sp.]